MKIEDMKSLLDKYDDAYYNKDEPLISDELYDTFKKSYLEKAGLKEYGYVPGEAVKEKKVTHTHPILSLSKVQQSDRGNLSKELNRLNYKSCGVCVEPKIDGLTIVRYPDGRYVTRGNGLIGEDRTEQCLQIEELKNINTEYTLRGEIYMTRENFNILNAEREAAGLELFKNPRNAAAGMIRNDNLSQIKGLNAFFYDIVDSDMSHTEKIDYMKNNKIRCVNSMCYTSVAYLVELITTMDRKQFPFDIDGIVIKSNFKESLKHFGITGHHPKNAVAVKFPSSGVWTKLTNVTWQVGKTGQVTPVGELEPVELDGSTISRVTLHNIGIINGLGIRIGGQVKITKANDVIPSIIEANGGDFPVSTPLSCPSCGSYLEITNNVLYCTGDSCRCKLEGKIATLASMDALNIEGLSDKTIEKMIDYRLNENISIKDINIFNIGLPFGFTLEEIEKLDGFAKKSAKKLYDNIQNAKNPELPNYLYAMSIPLLGRTASREISKIYLTLEFLLDDHYNDYSKLSKVDITGGTTTSITKKHVVSRKYDAIISNMRKYILSRKADLDRAGIYPKDYYVPMSNAVDRTVVITGKFLNDRKFIEKKLIEAGAKIGSSVTSKTDYLLAAPGEENSSKYKKAVKSNIPIFNSLTDILNHLESEI